MWLPDPTITNNSRTPNQTRLTICPINRRTDVKKWTDEFSKIERLSHMTGNIICEIMSSMQSFCEFSPISCLQHSSVPTTEWSESDSKPEQKDQILSNGLISHSPYGSYSHQLLAMARLTKHTWKNQLILKSINWLLKIWEWNRDCSEKYSRKRADV